LTLRIEADYHSKGGRAMQESQRNFPHLGMARQLPGCECPFISSSKLRFGSPSARGSRCISCHHGTSRSTPINRTLAAEPSVRLGSARYPCCRAEWIAVPTGPPRRCRKEIHTTPTASSPGMAAIICSTRRSGPGAYRRVAARRPSFGGG